MYSRNGKALTNTLFMVFVGWRLQCNLPADHDKPNPLGLCDTPGRRRDNM